MDRRIHGPGILGSQASIQIQAICKILYILIQHQAPIMPL